MKNKKVIKIKDLSHSACLKLYFPLKDVIREGNTVWFSFLDDGTASEVITKFINNELKCSIKEYDDNLKTLKQLIYNKK